MSQNQAELLPSDGEIHLIPTATTQEAVTLDDIMNKLNELIALQMEANEKMFHFMAEILA